MLPTLPILTVNSVSSLMVISSTGEPGITKVPGSNDCPFWVRNPVNHLKELRGPPIIAEAGAFAINRPLSIIFIFLTLLLGYTAVEISGLALNPDPLFLR